MVVALKPRLVRFDASWWSRAPSIPVTVLEAGRSVTGHDGLGPVTATVAAVAGEGV